VTASALVSVGYEGRTVQDLLEDLAREGVTVLVDVRMTPLSRKPGMSKRGLSDSLEAVGIRYVHLRALGNPRENRAAFRAGDPRGRAGFRRRLGRREAEDALQDVADLLGGGTVALLCFERDHRTCHRHLVAERVRRDNPSVELVEV
jgi:uncharacterized protein (DUF488 family)